ncbi:MAG: glycosyltransferase family 2 protein [Acidobacteria bacterium]|nr:glycosyltransferase family 2 protein [Acidobacteriota bacterium]
MPLKGLVKEMPLVSIIMPTFNRADTIKRAIDSVVAQSFTDWELLVVDDGSTDNTAAIVPPLDSRIVLIRQENQGVAGARNTGLRASRGALIAFLDSDDEWLPYFLELGVNFFRAFPEEDLLSGEIWEYFGKNRYVNHYRVEAEETYLKMARRINSPLLDLPKGESDPYLRFYECREAIGDWGRAVVERSGYQQAFWYHGDIFQHWRWGWMMTSQAMMMTRRAFERVGYMDSTYKVIGDFGWLANLCRHFRMNYLALPACIKHEYADENQDLAQHHIVKGNSENLYAKDMLRWFDELFGKAQPDDRELKALRGFRLYYIAQTALENGRRDEALQYLREAHHHFPALRRAQALQLLVRVMPNIEWARKTYDFFARTGYTWHLLLSKEVTVGALLYKSIGKIYESFSSVLDL